MRNIYTLPTIIFAGAALAACSMQPEKNATLDAARSGYSAAQSDPDVTNLAAIELQQAGNALDKANAAQKEREDREVVDHLAYLAKQRVAIAQETAKLKAAEMAVANASTARDKVLLEARTAQADAATQKAAAAQKAAQMKAEELAAANTEITNSKLRLDKQAAEADAAAKLQATASDNDARQAATALAAANARVAQMETELSTLNAKKTERGMVITLGDVLFDTNKADLRSRGSDSVKKLADFFKKYPERTATIEGYTDSTGSSDYNQGLSERRANAVRSALMSLGVNGDRISTRGLGEADPVASNDTPAGRQLNRRIEIILSDENVSVTAPQ